MTDDETVRFHGHERPGLAIGYRMATASMESLSSFTLEKGSISPSNLNISISFR